MSHRALLPSSTELLSMAISGPPGIAFYGRSAPGDDLVQVFTRVSGELDVRSLERGWRRAAARQALLDAARLQNPTDRRFYPPRVRPVMRQDWRRIPPPQQGERLGALIEQEAGLRVDPGQAPMMRLLVIKLADNSRLILLTGHHLAGGCAAALYLIDGLRRLIAQSRPLRLTQPTHLPIPLARTA